MVHINHLENLSLRFEHDDGYDEQTFNAEISEEVAREKLVFCGEDGERALEDCSYIWVDPDYVGQLSPGQQRLYEILLPIQQGAVYAVTTIGKLCEAQGLKNPSACCERLLNLQSLGAISGYRG